MGYRTVSGLLFQRSNVGDLDIETALEDLRARARRAAATRRPGTFSSGARTTCRLRRRAASSTRNASVSSATSRTRTTSASSATRGVRTTPTRSTGPVTTSRTSSPPSDQTGANDGGRYVRHTARSLYSLIIDRAVSRGDSTFGSVRVQGRRSHRIIGGDIKEDCGSGGRNPPEAEAFFVKLHIKKTVVGMIDELLCVIVVPITKLTPTHACTAYTSCTA